MKKTGTVRKRPARGEETILTGQKTALNPYESYKVMSSPAHGVFSNKYAASAGTIHTSVYFPKDLRAWFVMGPDREPVIFDFGKWLGGEDVFVRQIKGELEFDRPFVNMKNVREKVGE